MALLTNAGQSYLLSGANGVGLHNREDLSDFITNISPTECPFQQNIGSVKAKAVIHEWLTHELAAAAASQGEARGHQLAVDRLPLVWRSPGRSVPVADGKYIQ